MQGVGLNCEAGESFNLAEQLSRQGHIEILDGTRLTADEMAVGIGSVAVQPAAGTIQAFDHASRLQGFEILVNRRVADVAALIIELFEDVPSTEVAFFGPEQIEHHAPLAAQAHAQFPTTAIDVFDALQCHRPGGAGFAATKLASGRVRVKAAWAGGGRNGGDSHARDQGSDVSYRRTFQALPG